MNPRTKWSGQYFDGKTPVSQLVQIEIAGERLKFFTKNAERLCWPLQSLRQTQGHYAGEEVRLEHIDASGEMLVVNDSLFLTSLHQLAPHHVSHFHNPRTYRRRFWVTVGGGIMAFPLLWILYTQGVPALATPLTNLIPLSWERALGNRLLSELAPQETHCSNPSLQEKVDTLLQALTSKTGEMPYQFRVFIVNQSVTNAVALPGGNIILYRGLLEKTETPEELAGVMAHEIQHILQRHSMRQLTHNTTLGLVIGALTGDISGIMAFALEGAHLLQSLSYSRAAEEEADQKGLELLAAAGIDPQGMLSFFEYLQHQQDRHSPDRFWPYLSTHPDIQDRIENLAAFVNQKREPYHPLFPLDNWKQLVWQCNRSTANYKSESLSRQR